MGKKIFRVFLVAFVMAAVCCVGAFAADYPEEFPELDFTQYASAQFIPSNESVYFLIWEKNGSYSVLYSTYPLEVNTAGLSGDPYEFYTTFDSDGYAWYGVLKIHGDTVSSVLPYAGTSDDFRRGAGNLVYSSHSLRDRATGETLFPNGYPEELPEPSFLGDLRAAGTGVLSWAGSVAETIAGEPVLLLTVGVFILGAAIGIFRRLLQRG